MTEDLGEDRPRSLGSEAAREQRLAMIGLPHVAPLTAYVWQLRARGFGEVPYFDPLDGGVNAKVLFLFEKPGPMTSSDQAAKKGGSGFISRNNDDPTAEATFKFMNEAGLPRETTVTWNVVPGWNGTRTVRPDELRRGAACVQELVQFLPLLRVAVFVGTKAAKAAPYLAQQNLTLLSSDHPSPIVRASRRSRWEAIPFEWAKASQYL